MKNIDETPQLKDKIKAIRKSMGLTQVDFAQKIGVSSLTVSRWERGEQRPREEELLKMGINYSTTTLNNEATPADAAIKEMRKNGKFHDNHQLLMIPMISSEIKLSAGGGNMYEDIPWEVIGRYPVFDGELSAFYGEDGLTSMEVEGDSMEPQIHDRDVVIFNHDPDWIPGNIYVVCHNGLLLVKGLIANGTKQPPILRSSNKDYDDITVKQDDFFLVYGRVLKIETSRKPRPII